VDSRDLLPALREAFGGTDAQRRVVARQARDLADSGQLAADRGVEPTVDSVIDDMADAPDDCDLVERWNWWIGSLETAYGGYERFSVRAVDDEHDLNV
jgi:hypothetical protein